MDALKHDPGYQNLKEIDKAADERTLRYLLSQLTLEHIEQLRQVNDSILSLKADLDGPRSADGNCFITFCTISSTGKVAGGGGVCVEGRS